MYHSNSKNLTRSVCQWDRNHYKIYRSALENTAVSYVKGIIDIWHCWYQWESDDIVFITFYIFTILYKSKWWFTMLSKNGEVDHKQWPSRVHNIAQSTAQFTLEKPYTANHDINLDQNFMHSWEDTQGVRGLPKKVDDPTLSMLRHKLNGWHFVDIIFKCIFLK